MVFSPCHHCLTPWPLPPGTPGKKRLENSPISEILGAVAILKVGFASIDVLKRGPCIDFFFLLTVGQ